MILSILLFYLCIASRITFSYGKDKDKKLQFAMKNDSILAMWQFDEFRFVKIEVLDELLLIDIRDYYVEDDLLHPKANGISLTFYQFYRLDDLTSRINNKLDELRNTYYERNM